MGYLYKGDVKLIGTFSINAKKPLDDRSIVQNINELYTVDAKYAYKGMPVVSIDDATIYILIDEDNIGNKNGWKAITSVNVNPDNGVIDLSNYVTIKALNDALAEYNTTVDSKIESALQSYDTTIDSKIEEAVNNIDISAVEIAMDDEVTQTSSNPVKSSGIFNAITNMLNAKFVVLSEEEYEAMESHDATTFYFIKQ